ADRIVRQAGRETRRIPRPPHHRRGLERESVDRRDAAEAGRLAGAAAHLQRDLVGIMYKIKPCFRCHMPSDASLKVLALNASLKHEPLVSNTGELASLVLEELRALAPIDAEVVRLSDAALPVGLGFR